MMPTRTQICWLLLVSSVCLRSTTSSRCNNQFEEDTGSLGEDIWRSRPGSCFTPEQSISFGTIKLGREMQMTFDFTWNNYTFDPRGEPHNDYEQFFRVGCSAFPDTTPGSPCSGGNACSGSGARYPSFWVTPPLNTDGSDFGPPAMHLSISSDGDSVGHCQPNMDLTEWGELYVGVKLHIDIFWDEAEIIVGIGHYSNYTRDSTTFPEKSIKFQREAGTDPVYIGWDMPVWFMSDRDRGPLYNKGDATIENIEIISKYFNDPTSSPTSQPKSAVSTFNPTTADPTTCTTTATPTNADLFIIDPTMAPTKTLSNKDLPVDGNLDSDGVHATADGVVIRFSFWQVFIFILMPIIVCLLFLICVGLWHRNRILRKQVEIVKRRREKEEAASPDIPTKRLRSLHMVATSSTYNQDDVGLLGKRFTLKHQSSHNQMVQLVPASSPAIASPPEGSATTSVGPPPPRVYMADAHSYAVPAHKPNIPPNVVRDTKENSSGSGSMRYDENLKLASHQIELPTPGDDTDDEKGKTKYI